MFYVNVVHGRVIVHDLEQTRQVEQERVERNRQRDAERALADAIRRDASTSRR